MFQKYFDLKIITELQKTIMNFLDARKTAINLFQVDRDRHWKVKLSVMLLWKDTSTAVAPLLKEHWVQFPPLLRHYGYHNLDVDLFSKNNTFHNNKKLQVRSIKKHFDADELTIPHFLTIILPLLSCLQSV